MIDKGADIFEFLYKPKDIDFMWLSPQGIDSMEKFIPTKQSAEGNFLDYYEGGWQDIIPNFGIGVNYKGTEIGQHGETALIPWKYQILEDNKEIISIKFTVRTRRTPFYIEKILTLKSDDPKLYIAESIKNESYDNIELMWTQHPAFGPPFMDDSTIIDIPENRVKFIYKPENIGKYDELKSEIANWPTIKGFNNKIVDFGKSPTLLDEDHSIDQICLELFDDGWYAVTNLNKKVGFGIKWDKNIFPYLWIWRLYGKGFKGAPWWGRVSCMALELCSSFSPIGLNSAIKNKTAIKLGPQEKIKTSFFAIIYERDDKVKKIKNNGDIC